MSRFDTIVSAEAWERLVRDYKLLVEEEEDHMDVLADLLRDAIAEVEG